MTKNFLDGLSGGEALRILRNLCDSSTEIRERILSEAANLLSQLDPEEVANEVLLDLEVLDVDELWQRSGPSRDGYTEPIEMAEEMFEEVLKPYEDKIAQYQEMDMPEQARQYCAGVLQGIYQYQQETPSEFKEQAPDVAGECFGGILEEWRRRCTQENENLKMNEFLSRECPKWAE